MGLFSLTGASLVYLLRVVNDHNKAIKQLTIISNQMYSLNNPEKINEPLDRNPDGSPYHRGESGTNENIESNYN